MEFSITVFVRELHGGQVLARLAADPTTCVFAETLDEALLDLTLLLGDRLERSHPGTIHSFATPDNVSLQSWDLPAGIAVFGPTQTIEHPMALSCVVSRHKKHDRLWFPSWDLRHWVDAGDALAEEAMTFVAHYRRDQSGSVVLDRRIQGAEQLQTLTLDVQLPPLAAFTGHSLGLPLLPAKLPADEAAEARAKVERNPAAQTPTLERIGVDLTHRARNKALGRGVGLDTLVQSLATECTKLGAATVLVGASGLGKTAAVHELAHVLAPLHRKERGAEKNRVWFVDGNRLIAMHDPRSDWRSQTLAVVHECMASDAVWYVGSLLALLDAGKSAQSDENVAQLLRPFLARGRLKILGEATPEQWATLQLRDPGFARLFAPRRIEEPAPEASNKTLAGVAALRLAQSPVYLDPGAVPAAQELGRRFGGHAGSHAASLGLLIRAIGDRLSEESTQRRALDRAAVVATFCRESGMPPVLVRDDMPLSLPTASEALRRRVIGQPEAIDRVVDLIGLVKAGLTDPGRPLGSFLFVGPTGVGKTETAKALADYLYGSDARLVRFDMAELVTAEAVHRFIGSGGRPGKLVSEIRRLPFCVLLLDEIEKAHPITFDALLQVLGEARLSDEAGRTASFRNVVVVMTSNLGVDTLREHAGFGGAGTQGWAEHFTREARTFFRPEFFNRIDHVVPFDALGAESIAQIADGQLDRLATRSGLAGRGIRLTVAPAVRAQLIAEGTDPKLGARPLKRCIERRLAAPAARFISANPEASRPGVLHCERVDGAVVLRFDAAKSGPGKANDKALRDGLDAIAQLRYFVESCRASSTGRDLRLEVARVQRLLDNPRYLRGFAGAAERYVAAGDDQRLLRQFEELGTRMSALEDLAYEATHARTTDCVAMLGSERAGALEQLRDLGLAMAERGVPTPKAATLVLRHRGAGRFVSRLLRAYAAIAEGRGWTLTLHRTREVRPADPDCDEETVREFQAVTTVEPGGKVDALVGQAHSVDVDTDVFALHFSGPHAAVLLRGEAGVHVQHHQGETSRVQCMLPANTALLTTQYNAAEWVAFADTFVRRACRTIHESRNLVEDHRLAMTLPLEPRLGRLYERFASARVYDEAFFPGAHATLLRWWGGKR